jgi:DegV family protein with EDD domain
VSSPSPGITYLDGRRLSRSLLAAADWVDSRREELNRINVFPVPDGDTGTNFAVTLRAGAEAVRPMADRALPLVAGAAAEACVDAARGNSGLLLSQFLLGFREGIGTNEAVDTTGLARAIRGGADQLGAALDVPVEGTILTVCRDVADAAEATAARTSRLEELLPGMLASAWTSLRRTPDLLRALRDAGVVDAGAMAFVRTLEGVVRLIRGEPIDSAPVPPARDSARTAAARAAVAAEQDFRFCTEVLVRADRLPAAPTVRAALRPLGGSIVVLHTGHSLKLHIHTDVPEQVFELAGRWGTIEARKAEDVRAQHRALAAGTRKPVAIVVDSSCDLPDEILDRHGIEVVPLQVLDGDRSYQDRVELDPAGVFALMARPGATLTTSQPAPGAFARAMADARASAAQVLCLTLSSAVSGTYNSAMTAAKSLGTGNVTVVDSRAASLGLGLLAVRAAELAANGWTLERMVTELIRIRNQSGGLFTVDRFDQLLKSGRVSRGRALLGTLLNVKPILEIDQGGRVVPIDRVRGRQAVLPRVLRILDRRLTPRPARLRLGVAHGDAEVLALRVREELVRRYQPRECLVVPIATPIAVHAGAGAWGVFYQVEDEEGPEPTDQDGATPSRKGNYSSANSLLWS